MNTERIVTSAPNQNRKTKQQRRAKPLPQDTSSLTWAREKGEGNEVMHPPFSTCTLSLRAIIGPKVEFFLDTNLSLDVSGVDPTSERLLDVLIITGDKFNKKKARKRPKKYTTSVDYRKTKILCFRDKRISWASIRSDLSNAGVSVSSKTIRSSLADTHLRLMIQAWCRSRPNVQKGLTYDKYVEPQTFYQWCCVGSNSGGVLVTIPCVKVMDGAVSTAALCNCNPARRGSGKWSVEVSE
ncbi:hypothetical protein TNCV_1888471 [Trichonephila clavipes]|nr:hypothetical protein TNCV_1888471 [Trichonephila clavipes]